MKETDSLETRLRSWRPRRPSAKLERRLFAAPFNLAAKMGWLVGSLAPAAVCLLFTISAFKNDNAGISLRTEPMIAMIFSNQNYAAYASGNFRAAQNNLAAVTFEWTNHSLFPSSMAPF